MEPQITKELTDDGLQITQTSTTAQVFTLLELQHELMVAQNAKAANVAAGVSLDTKITDLQASIAMFPGDD